MSTQEPAWLKRTRPCPFFSQGRCLFADSCNFLHDIKVRNPVDQSVRNTVLAKQSPIIKPVFNPPSVVVNSASPRPVNLSSPESLPSPIHDSSRYSGLLSALSDVIGPSPDSPVSDVISESPAPSGSSGRTSYLQTTATLDQSRDTDSPVASDSSLARFKFPDTVAASETGWNVTAQPRTVLHTIDEAVPDATSFSQEGAPVQEEDGEPVTEFITVPDHDEAFPDEATLSYLVEDGGPYVIGSDEEEEDEGDDNEDVDARSEEDAAVMVSNRQSILSSFTGASLLTSPPGNVFGEPLVDSPTADGSPDLLSPVTMSAKLRPFPISSFDSKAKRGDSIDSGYADSWTSPLLFPRSPPRSFRSSVGFFPPHSRRGSFVSPTTLQDRRVSYDVRAVRPSPQAPIQSIEEAESESDESSENNEDTAFAILGAYDSSLSEEQEEDEVQDSRRVDVAAVAKRSIAESDKLSVPPSLSRRSRQSSPKHLRATSTTSDLEVCSPPSFISDDKDSFTTALSTQPSFDNLSDASTRVSPVKQDSLLSFISRTSTPDTSLLDHSRELLDRHTVDSPVEKASSSPLIEVMCSTAHPCTLEVGQDRTSVASPTREAPDIDRPREAFPQSAAAAKKRFSQVEVLRILPLVGNAPRCAVPDAREDTRVLRPDMHTPVASVSTEPTLASTTAEYNVSSPVEDTRALDRHSVELRGPMEPTLEPPLANVAVGHSASYPVEDAAVLRSDRYSVELWIPVQPIVRPPTGDAHRSAAPGADSQSPKSRYSSELSDSVSYDGHGIGIVAPVADGKDSGISEPSPSVAYAGLLDILNILDIPPVQDDQILAVDDSCVSEDLTESSSSESNSFTQSHRLTFPLPPPFLPAEFVEHSTLSFEETSISPVVESIDVAEDETAALSTEAPAEEMQRLRSSSDLTERAGPSQVHSVRSPDSGPDFFSPWSRAAGDQIPASSTGGSVDVAEDVEGMLSTLLTETHAEEMQRLRSGSDLTEIAIPSQVQAFRALDSDTGFFSRRSRAVSDITVKARSSPVVFPDASPIPGSLSVPVEDPSQSDSVNLLYDQYFDDDTSGGTDEDMADGHIHSSSPIREDHEPRDLLGLVETLPPETSLHVPASSLHAFPLESVLRSDVSPTRPSADSPPSEPVFRPLLTGRRSLLNSPLGELISKANAADAREPSSMPTPPSKRLQTREPGNTMVPLGFRRFKPKPAPQLSLRSVAQPLLSALPVSELREVLRIRTDISEGDLPLRCSSADFASSTWSPLPTPSLSAPPTGGLKPLRLSTIISNSKRSSILSSHSSSIASSIVSLDHMSQSYSSHSPTVSSVTSLSPNSLLSSSCPPIPEHIQHTLARSTCNSPILQTPDHAGSSRFSSSRRDSRSVSAPLQQQKHWRLSHYRAGSRNYTSAAVTRRLSRRTSTLSLSYVPEQEGEDDDDPTIACHIQSAPPVDWMPPVADWMRPASALAAPVHAIATPKPTLLFAIASDNVEQVRQVLESGEAGPNDPVGPQSALAFTLTNDKLSHKQEIVKALLAYGANPAALRNPAMNPSPRLERGDEPIGPPPETTLEGMDPATRYFIARAATAHTRQTSQLIYRSFFRPLTRVRYDVIGQDWALEQLFRVLSIHSQKLAVAPIVVLLCGPSGHGKSLLARKFGSLLDVPTHTVNMTTLRSTHDIWQSYSMSPYEEPSSCTLSEFLMENEGKRCVVVLDEIEKVEDQKALWSLLMPWELGRCSLEAGKRHVDARNVIWLGTSNVGHELVFEHHQNRVEPDKQMTREEYLELTEILRPRVSHHLGASLVSRVTTVLPFVPFTLDERKAIAAEAVYALAGEAAREISPQDVESLVTKALPSYHPSEGARSLHRAVSNLLIDSI